MTRRVARTAQIGVLVVALALVPAGFAAKGGGGQGGDSTTTATLVSDCNPCAAGTIAHFTGSGYDPWQGAQIYFTNAAGSTTGAAVPVAADGTVSFGWNMSPAGTYEVRAMQWGKGRKLVLKATTTVTAQ
jgi:hypothetical protein